MAFDDSVKPKSPCPVVFEVRPGVLYLAESLIHPDLIAALQLSGYSLMKMDEARTTGDETSALQYELEGEFFTDIAVDLLGILARTLGGDFAEAHAMVLKAVAEKRGAVQ